MSYSSNTFVILAASPTRNIRGKSVSKVLIKDKTLLDLQIKTIQNFCADARIIVVTGFDKVTVDDRFEAVSNDLYYQTYQSESINLAIKDLKDTNVWIIHGDLYFTKTAFRVASKHCFCVNVDRTGSIRSSKVGLRHDAGKLICLEYGLPEKWGQIFYVPASQLDVFKKTCRESRSLFLYEIINQLAQDNQIYVFGDSRAKLVEIESSK